MKKYLFMSLKVILYVAIMVVVAQLAHYLIIQVWAGQDIVFGQFIDRNFPLFVIVYFLVTVAIYIPVFALQKRNLLKVASFSKVSVPHVGYSALLAVFGSLGIVSIVGLSFVHTSVPILEIYLEYFYDRGECLAFLLVMLAAIHVLEEVIFRGVIFNELRRTLRVGLALVIQALVYAVLQGDLAIGLFAFVSAIVYCLPYLWTGSLWASITTQFVGAVTVIVYRRTGIGDAANAQGDGFLIVLLAISLVLLGISIFFFWRSAKKRNVSGAEVTGAVA